MERCCTLLMFTAKLLSLALLYFQCYFSVINTANGKLGLAADPAIEAIAKLEFEDEDGL